MSSRKILTIAIEHQTARICETNFRNAKNPVIHQAFSVHISENNVLDGYINDIRTLGEFLKEKINVEGIKSREVVFTIASSRIMSREVEIPLVKDAMISSVVQAQANEYMPIDVGDYIISHTVLEKNKQEKTIKLMIFAAPNDLVDDYYKLAEVMGVKVESVDYVGNSIYQWVRHTVKDKAGLVVSIHGTSTIATIMDNQKLMLQRSIATGTDLLLQKDTFAGAVTFEDNQEINQGGISRDEVDLLIGSLGRIMEYHNNSKKGNPVEKIYINGDVEALKELPVLVEEALGVKTELMSTCGNQPSYYLACLGASLQPAELIPYELVDFEQKKFDNRTYFAMLGAVAAVCVFTILICQLQYFSVKGENKQLQAEIKSKEYIVEINEQYEAIKRQHNYLINLDGLTNRNNENLVALLTEFEDKLPTSADITSMTSAGDSFSVSFKVPNERVAAKVVMQLQEIPYIGDVEIGGVTTDETDGRVDFQVTCTYSEGGGLV